jgi:FKBP-type peptidyl-prolyl cis-trans isomerase SlyD
MSNELSVADGKVVAIHFTLRTTEGEVIDSSAGGPPLEYLHGAHNIVPGLERALAGHAIGDKVKAEVPPEDGYGQRGGPEPQRVPRSSFPSDAQLHEGMQIFARGPDKEPFPLWVVGVADDHVMVDHNHPLAGIELHFEVEIVAIRDATEEEISHGHAHRPGHHHHHN